MTAATKRPKSKPDDAAARAVDAARQAADGQRRLLAGYEAICKKLAEGGDRTPDDELVFHAVAKDPETVERDVSLFREVLRHQKFAGSETDRAKARQTLDAAQNKQAVEAPALHQQITDLQTKLANLDNDMMTAQADVARRETSVEWLRNIDTLPTHVRDGYKSMHKQLNNRLRPAIGKLESRLKTIDGVTGMRWETHIDPQHQNAVNHARHHNPAVVSENVKGPRIDDDAWVRYRNELENERVELVQQLRPLKQQYDRELETVEKMLDYWLEC